MRKIILALCGAVAMGLISSGAMAGDALKLSVEQMNQQARDLGGKQVELHGEVVKVNNGIMRRNFVHIKDGTGSGNNGKVIVTSPSDTAQVGQKVKVVGTVVLDTDFGMGYAYPLLIENSSITIE